MKSSLLSLLWVLSLVGAAACNPPCRQTCRKLLDCGNLSTDRLAVAACEADCEQQAALYDTWEDKDKQALYRDHKRCLADATCEEIDEGVCYDGYEELFVIDAE